MKTEKELNEEYSNIVARIKRMRCCGNCDKYRPTTGCVIGATNDKDQSKICSEWELRGEAMTPEQKQAELDRLRWWLKKQETWAASRRNDAEAAEIEIYCLKVDIARLEKEGGE